MTREEIKQAEDELNGKKQDVVRALEKALKEKEGSERKIIECDEALPGILASIALQEGSSSKLNIELVINGRARDKEQRVIDRYPFLLRGLEAAGKKLCHPGVLLDNQKQRWNRYDRVKSEISDHPFDRYHDGRVSKLKELATHPDLDCVRDAEDFLKGLDKKGK